MWSKKTYCKVHDTFMAGEDDMCPKRKNVCVYCCLKCYNGKCEFEGNKNSIEFTINCEKVK